MRLATVGLSLFGLWALSMLSLAILGGYQLYSPVPLYDSWDGIVHFLQQPHFNSLAPWLAQHNEHRPVLSRLLFWLDDRYFDGASYFLIISNYVCVAASVYVFWRIVRRLSGTVQADKGQVAVGLFILAWLFQWMQVENFSWAFQSQFFLAQLLPLCALYSAYLSVAQPQKPRLFWQACALGVLSVGTMANGMLALPLMTVYAVWLRQSWPRVLSLAGLSLVACLLYFSNYITPEGHGSLGHALWHDPLGVIHYVINYLGNPFYYLAGQRKLGCIIAALSGVVFIGLVLRSAWSLWRAPVKQPLPIAVLLYVLYLGATALGTAGGREMFGVAQALSSRYTTPTLMAWLAVALLYWPVWRSHLTVKHRWLWLLLLILMVLMSRQQSKVLRWQTDTVFQQKVAGLALELNIPDMEQLKAIYPVPLRIWGITQQAFGQQRCFFKRYPFVGLRQQLAKPVSSIMPTMACQGMINQRLPIAGDSRFMSIDGGVSKLTNADLVRFLNERQQVIGYAMVSSPLMCSSKRWPYVYKGYVLVEPLSTITLQVLYKDDVMCQVRLPISP